ncbi:MAG TPA: nucleotide exchange factor GrpE [Candidatus Polarisedimenticolia bacterium]|jgi:molecular chaperone GrpE|nr:nucleotide exchange factor GrpE [Candidatus Polarisedimenticolia bacterium]
MSARPSGRPNKRHEPASEKEEDAKGSGPSCDLPATGDDDIEILEVTGINETEPLAGEGSFGELVSHEAEAQHDGHGGHAHAGAHAGPSHPGGDDTDDLRRRLDEAEKEKERLHDLWLRAHAETSNVRKQMDREAVERRVRETTERLRALLPVLDSLERAIQSPGWGDDGLRQGVALTLQQMLEVLGRDGLKPVDSQGRKFDPQVHEAVETVTTAEAPEGTVIEEMQRGYLLRDRLVRPALVKVAAAEGTESAPAPQRRRAAG